ncbi:MAG TPA: hypothetical protein DG753_08530 [Clostridium sp.]|nr:hypothetical protein [Clostridium sp.]
MGRKNKNIDTFACPVEEDDIDICGFSDEPIVKGNCVSSFSFDTPNSETKTSVLINDKPKESTPKEISFSNPVDNTNEKNDNSNIFDNRRTPIANGAAPAIDGETPSIRRCYILRESTIRKINELKMMDNDINVCVSTIVDLAIDYYYKTISSFSSNSSSNN